MAKNSPARKARLRERARQEAIVRKATCVTFLRDGKSCQFCEHLGKAGFGLNYAPCCDLDSDFHGYVLIKHPPTHTCTRWTARAAPRFDRDGGTR